MDIQKRDILETIKAENSKSGVVKTSPIDKFFDISPEDFLKFANEDIESDIEHKVVNALSNAKRALDCQLESILFITGHFKKSQSERWGFPKKIEALNNFEILAPRILRKINKQRNLLEHQFVEPKLNQVEDFIDIAMLFIASTNKYIKSFITHFQIRSDSLNHTLLVTNDLSNQQITIGVYPENSWPSLSTSGKKKGEQNSKKFEESLFSPVCIGKFSWNCDDKNHSYLLKYYLSHYR